MLARLRFRPMIPLLAAAVLVLIAGCGDDPVSAKPGTITITVSPAGLAAGWTLAGPNEFEQQGVGDATLDDLVPGDYTLTWDAVANYRTPDTVTASLSTGGSITFAGFYEPLPAGSADKTVESSD